MTISVQVIKFTLKSQFYQIANRIESNYFSPNRNALLLMTSCFCTCATEPQDVRITSSCKHITKCDNSHGGHCISQPVALYLSIYSYNAHNSRTEHCHTNCVLDCLLRRPKYKIIHASATATPTYNVLPPTYPESPASIWCCAHTGPARAIDCLK